MPWSIRPPELDPHDRGGSARYSAMTSKRGFEVEDSASAIPRLEGGATLILEAGRAADREPGNLRDFMMYASEGGAGLRTAGSSLAPLAGLRIFTDHDGENVDCTIMAKPGLAHQGVIDHFVAVVLGGETARGAHDGSLALTRALVLDTCHQLAREQREVRL